MADWGDETAARCIKEWSQRFPDHGFGGLPVSVVAESLRKARAVGMREAASVVLSFGLEDTLRARADRIERGEDG